MLPRRDEWRLRDGTRTLLEASPPEPLHARVIREFDFENATYALDGFDVTVTAIDGGFQFSTRNVIRFNSKQLVRRYATTVRPSWPTLSVLASIAWSEPSPFTHLDAHSRLSETSWVSTRRSFGRALEQAGVPPRPRRGWP